MTREFLAYLDRFGPNARKSTIKHALLVDLKNEELRECAAVQIMERDLCRIVQWEVAREMGSAA